MENKSWFDSKLLCTNQLIPRRNPWVVVQSHCPTNNSGNLSIQEPLILQLRYTASWHIVEDDQELTGAYTKF